MHTTCFYNHPSADDITMGLGPQYENADAWHAAVNAHFDFAATHAA